MKFLVVLMLLLIACKPPEEIKPAPRLQPTIDVYQPPARPTLPPGVTTFVVYGNPDSKIYHHPPNSPQAQQPCRLLNPSKAIRFNSPAEAKAAGYRPCETRGCNLP